MDKEKLFEKAIDENLEQEIRSIPEEKEIRKMHTFSAEFRRKMRELTGKREIIWKGRYTAVLAAAAACVLLIITGIPDLISGPAPAKDMGMSVSDGAAADADIAEESSSEKGWQDEKATGTESDMADDKVDIEDEQDLPGVYPSYGEQAALHLDQEVYEPEAVLILSVENLGTGRITYGAGYNIQVFRDGQWWTLTEPWDAVESIETEQEEEIKEIEIDLALYDLNKRYSEYRVVKEINGEVLAVEFEVRWQDE